MEKILFFLPLFVFCISYFNINATSYLSDIYNDSSSEINFSCAHGSGVNIPPNESHHIFSLNCPIGGAPEIINNNYNAASIITELKTNKPIGYVIDSGMASVNVPDAYAFYTISANFKPLSGFDIAYQNSVLKITWLKIRVDKNNNALIINNKGDQK